MPHHTHYTMYVPNAVDCVYNKLIMCLCRLTWNSQWPQETQYASTWMPQTSTLLWRWNSGSGWASTSTQSARSSQSMTICQFTTGATHSTASVVCLTDITVTFILWTWMEIVHYSTIDRRVWSVNNTLSDVFNSQMFSSSWLANWSSFKSCC